MAVIDDPAVLCGEAAAQLLGVVRGGIVADHQFEVLVVLVEHGLDHALDPLGAVADRQPNRDKRVGVAHRISLVTQRKWARSVFNCRNWSNGTTTRM